MVSHSQPPRRMRGVLGPPPATGPRGPRFTPAGGTPIAQEAAEAVLRRVTGELAMTTPPLPPLTQGGQSEAVPANPHSFLGGLHHGLDVMGATITRLWPMIRRIAESPRIDALVEAALNAENLGVASEVFETVIDALNAAAARRQAALPPAATSGPAAVMPADGQGVPVTGPLQ